jgi:hypothetical protein
MIDKKIEIIDNFLPLDEFKEIQETITSSYFPWFINLNVLYADEAFDKKDHLFNYQFVHSFYNNWRPASGQIDKIDKFVNKINPAAILRIKANLNPVTEKRIIHGMHIDYLEPCKTGIFYINTNNGITTFEDGTEIESIENRFVTFDSRLFHSGSTCTDKKARYVININYIERIEQHESRDF